MNEETRRTRARLPEFRLSAYPAAAGHARSSFRISRQDLTAVFTSDITTTLPLGFGWSARIVRTSGARDDASFTSAAALGMETRTASRRRRGVPTDIPDGFDISNHKFLNRYK